jgi:hypothetical protein
MSTATTRPQGRLIGVLVTTAGGLVAAASGVTVGMVSCQLDAEHVTVTAAGPQDLGSPGKPVTPARRFPPAGTNQGNNKDAITCFDTRDSIMNGSFLLASLFMDAVAFGVAAPVMGIGALVALVELAQVRSAEGAALGRCRQSRVELGHRRQDLVNG